MVRFTFGNSCPKLPRIMSIKIARLFIFGLALAAASAVWAQYQWIDQDGRRVFSDRPPSADVPDRNIISQPGAGALATQRPAAPSDVQASTDKADDLVALQSSGTDAELERKKKAAEQAEAAAADAKQKTEQERLAAARAENCRHARNSLISLQSGVRMGYTNDKGEREVMNDTQRAAELQRTERVIASNCD